MSRENLRRDSMDSVAYEKTDIGDEVSIKMQWSGDSAALTDQGWVSMSTYAASKTFQHNISHQYQWNVPPSTQTTPTHNSSPGFFVLVVQAYLYVLDIF